MVRQTRCSRGRKGAPVSDAASARAARRPRGRKTRAGSKPVPRRARFRRGRGLARGVDDDLPRRRAAGTPPGHRSGASGRNLRLGGVGLAMLKGFAYYVTGPAAQRAGRGGEGARQVRRGRLHSRCPASGRNPICKGWLLEKQIRGRRGNSAPARSCQGKSW